VGGFPLIVAHARPPKQANARAILSLFPASCLPLPAYSGL